MVVVEYLIVSLIRSGAGCEASGCRAAADRWIVIDIHSRYFNALSEV
jgi:hypothetical protein